MDCACPDSTCLDSKTCVHQVGYYCNDNAVHNCFIKYLNWCIIDGLVCICKYFHSRWWKLRVLQQARPEVAEVGAVCCIIVTWQQRTTTSILTLSMGEGEVDTILSAPPTPRCPAPLTMAPAPAPVTPHPVVTMLTIPATLLWSCHSLSSRAQEQGWSSSTLTLDPPAPLPTTETLPAVARDNCRPLPPPPPRPLPGLTRCQLLT